ncbi:hypothetical protein BHM03_00028988 [Ensete ventricosum]|nr:hypothetical protein BHM03_00028988 [Ensete ventricosum]
MVRPFARATGHDLATYKWATDCGQGPLQRGNWLQPRPPSQGAVGCGQLAGAAGACGHNRLQHGTRRGGRLLGSAGRPPHKGLLVRGEAAG